MTVCKFERGKGANLTLKVRTPGVQVLETRVIWRSITAIFVAVAGAASALPATKIDPADTLRDQ